MLRDHTILRAAFILLIGAGAGLAYNAFSAIGIPLRTPDQVPFADLMDWSLRVEGLRVTLKEAQQAFDRKEALFIDARSAAEYAAGHIPGAIHLPASDFEGRGREVLRGVPGDARIIAYCSGGGCQSSLLLSRLLSEKAGYLRTQVFYDGWRAWMVAGYPFVVGSAP